MYSIHVIVFFKSINVYFCKAVLTNKHIIKQNTSLIFADCCHVEHFHYTFRPNITLVIERTSGELGIVVALWSVFVGPFCVRPDLACPDINFILG